MIVLFVIISLLLLLGLIAILNKPSSVYKHQTSQQNPMEGRRVVFVENPSEPMNADGVCGHLEAIGDSRPKGGFYNTIIKRFLILF